jgi:hypothetical protein
VVRENYKLLTLQPEIEKSNLYWVSAAAILGRFSNNAAVAVRSNTLSVGPISRDEIKPFGLALGRREEGQRRLLSATRE